MSKTMVIIALIAVVCAVDQIPTQRLTRCGPVNPTSVTECDAASVGNVQCCLVNAADLAKNVENEIGASFSDAAFENTQNYCAFRFDYDYSEMYTESEFLSGLESWKSHANKAIECSSALLAWTFALISFLII